MFRRVRAFRYIANFRAIFNWLFLRNFSKIAAFQQFFKFPFN